MLLSLRNRLTVALCPTHIAVVESKHGWHPQPSPVAFTFELFAGEPGWQAPVAALRHWLEQNKRAQADVDVIIPDCFIRYALIPWSKDVQKTSEMAILSRIHFETLFGAQAADWKIQVDCGDYEKAGIGCAIDKALMKALEELFATHRLRFRSLQPYFMRAFNRWRRKISRDALFALIEPGQCVLASSKGGAWHSIRTIRLGENRESELPVLIKRETLLQGLGEQTPVYLHTLEPITPTVLKWESNMTLLETPTAAAGQAVAVTMILNGVT